jgi:hypothetical protein
MRLAFSTVALIDVLEEEVAALIVKLLPWNPSSALSFFRGLGFARFVNGIVTERRANQK